ncbi:4-hydroxybenzoate octaprenyltransferase [Ketogulonicigenium vulgare]|nr:4-hydroxybenzoate octaprenyltransferase [Ketogulonicigenium vulgare]ADO41739.1 4-hydroxybenzoate polyprenyl transferase [Ketogulonicigenium vulgare Y25]ALJ80181.1 4-hydroxybenzoate octaprenyltransferase [Ketogulonicigenium vulgare]ANW33043.1 4-hydroxybenzoate polyprenyltransferase [Ketogulonicigenium vulgare]AOZ53670.1 4-hydroxybenzoate polyprenyl transferase [Ketogulonicigenium vulgare]
MRSAANTPEATAAVADSTGNWVDRAPLALRPWLRLSRIDRPIGTWLLLLPCWWSLLLAALSDGRFGWFDLWIAVGCAIGALLMRGAGCTWNDITDRHIDGKVARTALRPIPSGQVSVRGAAVWMAVQVLISAAVLFTFNIATVALGVLALVPVVVYPFAKRFTWWPQAFLGIAFNWGALVGWTAHTGSLGWQPVVLYLGGIAWTLFYDTIYAHQDFEDDALIGVKSTARLFGDDTPRWLAIFAALTVALTAIATFGTTLGAGAAITFVALLAPIALGGHLIWQMRRFDAKNSAVLLRLFRANRDAGLLFVLFSACALALQLIHIG